MNSFELIQQIKLDIKKGKFKSNKDISANDFADYPWDTCVADQIKAYGSKSIAEKVCGKIKSENSSKEQFTIPHPSAGESQNEFISRCMSSLSDEDKPQDQLLAICYAQWEKK